MSVAEQIASTPDRADRGGGRFLSEPGPFWRLLIRGAALMLITLGVYRFWLVTDIRRFLWGHTEISGVVIEYLAKMRALLLRSPMVDGLSGRECSRVVLCFR